MAINNEQRKRFEIIIQNKYNTSERLVRDKIQMLDSDIQSAVKNKLGIGAMETLIRAKEEELQKVTALHRTEITKLEEKLYEVKGGRYGNNTKSEYHKTLKKYQDMYNTDLRGIETGRNNAIAKVWGSEDIEEILTLIEEVEATVAEQYAAIDAIKPQIAKQLGLKELPDTRIIDEE